MLEKNLYSDFFRSNVFKISIKFNYSVVYFSISVTILIYYLGDLSTVVSGELIFLPLLLLLFCEVPPLYLFVFVSYIWMFLYWCMFVDEHNIFSLYWSFYHYIVYFLSLLWHLLQILFCLIWVLGFLLSCHLFVWNIFFSSTQFQYKCVLRCKGEYCRKHIVDLLLLF